MPWGKRIFYRSKSSTPSGPALDLLAPKQAFDESGSPTTTTTEDGTPVSDDEEEDETDNEGLSQSATKRLGQRFCVLAGLVATLLLVLGCIRIAVAYNRAEVAADALIRSFTGGIDEQPITWLEDADKRMSMTYEDYKTFVNEDADERKTERKTKRKRRGHRRRPRDDDETDYALSKPDDLDDELLQRAGRGPATAQHDKAGNEQFWGDAWLMAEINRLTEWKRQMMNNDTSQLAGDMQPQLYNNPSIVIEKFTGMDSMYLDKFRANMVKTDLETGTATAIVQVSGHTTKQLRCHGRASAKGNGRDPWYHFTIMIDNFWMNARKIEGEVDLGIPPVMKKAKVGWVDTGFGNLDAVCYSKKDPRKKDGMCTNFLKKKLNKERGSMNFKVAKKITEVMQDKIDAQMVGAAGHTAY